MDHDPAGSPAAEPHHGGDRGMVPDAGGSGRLSRQHPAEELLPRRPRARRGAARAERRSHPAARHRHPAARPRPRGPLRHPGGRASHACRVLPLGARAGSAAPGPGVRAALGGRRLADRRPRRSGHRAHRGRGRAASLGPRSQAARSARHKMEGVSEPVDVVLIGGGVMSATLGSLLQQLEPSWSITLLEALPDVAQESSNPWNNAGTGHSALCELNYTPEKNGQIDISKAVQVNEQFQVSRQYWSYLVSEGLLPEPEKFINPVPHLSFVWGENNVDYLRRRYEALKDHPLFPGLEYTEDPRVIREWAPLLLPGRKKSQPIAATRIVGGSDVDFGSLTRNLIDGLVEHGAKVLVERRVTGLKRLKDGTWRVTGRHVVGNTPF